MSTAPTWTDTNAAEPAADLVVVDASAAVPDVAIGTDNADPASRPVDDPMDVHPWSDQIVDIDRVALEQDVDPWMCDDLV